MKKSTIKKAIIGALAAILLIIGGIALVIVFAIYGLYAMTRDLIGAGSEVVSTYTPAPTTVQLDNGGVIQLPSSSVVNSAGKVTVVRVQFTCPQQAGERTFVEFHANEEDARRVQCWNSYMPRGVTTSLVSGTVIVHQ